MVIYIRNNKRGEGDFERMVQKNMFVFLSDSGDAFFKLVL